MEDRTTPGLYLEMTDRPIGAYVETRVAAVLAHDGVGRATWWRNVNRDREDLPRQIPEFGLLAVYEIDDRFEPPALPDEVSGMVFRHTPRPGQGRITGRPTLGLSLVLISPIERHQAQELRDWADFVHIRFIAEANVPGYTMITPYENATGGDPLYLHFYEMDTDQPEEAFQTMTPLVRRHLASSTAPTDQHPGDGAVSSRPSFRDWAFHDALRIIYVNSFVRVGERP